ncbi:alpha-glucuronidase family glycosyl hydrolase [Cellvibrio mixtus]|uniref:alpha-glucuronidase family glycosyl hydrolase n=1 Tax=Cellvibrio mixtus TaxID=39650 RepID=UPI000587424E|nr:alpha-glucuronidase family glycosyl hydrolase [Cellvibrio mixtus]
MRRAFLYKIFLLLTVSFTVAMPAHAEDGYEAWLRYQPVVEQKLRKAYQQQLRAIITEGNSPTLQAATGELQRGLSGLLAKPVAISEKLSSNALVVGTPASSPLIASLDLSARLSMLGNEGYLIEKARINKRNVTVIAANSDTGVLYGSFHLLRLLQTQQALDNISISSAPKLQHRVINHWDNLNRVIERGYAGLSLWDWGTLPEHKSQRYVDYARINASLGINGTVINNVNADPRVLSDQFLQKIAALADVFRPYGIKVYLSINYNSPRAFGDLDTADPLDPRVAKWWQERTKKVYDYIPDFGGYLVKANSEGQPGPQDYKRNHADGANMLAAALKPYGGIVFWRAFVYHPDIDDRFRGSYDEFKPLDGKFADNVILQVKNGPIDFQPREPYSALFSAMEKTNMMMEFQVTQEYFGFATHLAYQGSLFEESLRTETYVKGEGSTIGNILEGKTFNTKHTGMAAVINPGTDRNWTGHPFVQSSWYAFGRMAWDHSISADVAADEWLRMTFTNDKKFIEPVKQFMLASREAGVNYRSPLGLTHLYSQGDHYGPAPWTANLERPDWTAIYYHRAAKDGIGFNRTKTGSNAVAQYPETLAKQYGDLKTVPEDLLLWFHHVSWDHQMQSGRTLWNELVHKYYDGVEQVRSMQREWEKLESFIDAERFAQVKALLKIQERDAVIWRDSCVLYFQTFSGKPIPAEYEQPKHDLEYYKTLARTRYVPEPWHPASSSRVLK